MTNSIIRQQKPNVYFEEHMDMQLWGKNAPENDAEFLKLNRTLGGCLRGHNWIMDSNLLILISKEIHQLQDVAIIHWLK